nr:cell division protein ZapB [uncultured Desulfobacter sp.]
MNNEDIAAKFDDINIHVDFLIESCQTLQKENKELSVKVRELEEQLEQKTQKEDVYVGRESMISEKISGLLSKLDGFSETVS